MSRQAWCALCNLSRILIQPGLSADTEVSQAREVLSCSDLGRDTTHPTPEGGGWVPNRGHDLCRPLQSPPSWCPLPGTGWFRCPATWLNSSCHPQLSQQTWGLFPVFINRSYFFFKAEFVPTLPWSLPEYAIHRWWPLLSDSPVPPHQNHSWWHPLHGFGIWSFSS